MEEYKDFIWKGELNRGAAFLVASQIKASWIDTHRRRWRGEDDSGRGDDCGEGSRVMHMSSRLGRGKKRQA